MKLNRTQCNLDWGVDGCLRAVQREEIVVIVDCLSFSTAVVTAVEQGAEVYPCSHATDSTAFARQIDAELAVKRPDVPKLGCFSLSPPTLLKAEAGTKIVLPSLNGGSCVETAIISPVILAGALINARAILVAVTSISKKTGKSVTIIACGELEESDEGRMELRHAEEDYLSAGAIIAEMNCPKSPEAEESERSFDRDRAKTVDTVWESPSGVWLRERGFGADVEFALLLNRYNCVPVLVEGRFTALDSSAC